MFISPSAPMIWNIGMKSRLSGTRYVRNTPVASAALPQKRIRASANAARIEITMLSTTTTIVTFMEFRKNVRKFGDEMSSMKLSSTG